MDPNSARQNPMDMGVSFAVIPGRSAGPNPESRDSGLALRALRNDTSPKTPNAVAIVATALSCIGVFVSAP